MTGLPKSSLIKYMKMKNADKPRDNQLKNIEGVIISGTELRKAISRHGFFIGSDSSDFFFEITKQTKRNHLLNSAFQSIGQKIYF